MEDGYLSAKVGCCERCCLFLRKSNLVTLILVDLGFGAMLITFSCYLYTVLNKDFSNSHLAWMEWGCVIVGALLVLSAMTACCAVTSSSCRGIIVVSSYLSFLIAIFAVILATLSFILRKEVFEYFDNHSDEFDWSDEEKQRLETWYVLTACCLYASFILQVLRRLLSKGFRAAAERSDNEYVALMAEEEAQHQEKLVTSADERRQKYADLRDYYRTKYNIRSSRDQSLEADFQSGGGSGGGGSNRSSTEASKWYNAPDDSDVLL